MRAVPQSILILLLLSVCGLCAVQWYRESTLREFDVAQRKELSKATAMRDDLDSKMKGADVEIQRLNGALHDLRTNSISKQEHDDVMKANVQLHETVVKLNAAIKEENEAIAKQNAAIQQANESIKKLADERDSLARRVNEIIARYNKLLEDKKSN